VWRTLRRRLGSVAPWHKALGANHPDVALTLNNLAVLYRTQGCYADAAPLYKRGLTIRESALGTNHPEVATSLHNLADLYGSQGRYTEAEPLNKRSLVIRETVLGANHPHIAVSLRDLGLLEMRQMHWPQAHDYLQRAAVIQVNRDVAAAGDDQKSGEGEREQRFAFFNFAESLWELGQTKLGRRDELMAEAFAAAQSAERQAAGAALTQMAARFGAGSAALAQRVRERQDAVRTWQDLDKKLIAAISAPAGKRNEGETAGLRKALEDTDQQLADVAARLAADFPQFSELTSPKPLTLAAAQRLLAPEEALVVFLMEVDKGFVWAVSREEADWHRVPTGSKALGARVAALRQGLGSRRDRGTQSRTGLGITLLAHAAATARRPDRG